MCPKPGATHLAELPNLELLQHFHSVVFDIRLIHWYPCHATLDFQDPLSFTGRAVAGL